MVFGLKLPKESLVSLNFATSECLLKMQGTSSHIPFFTVKFPMFTSKNWTACCTGFMKYQDLPGMETLCFWLHHI